MPSCIRRNSVEGEKKSRSECLGESVEKTVKFELVLSSSGGVCPSSRC